ncbi:TPA: hypothetical protein ACU8LT_003132 [Salmonella enterica]
MLGTNGLPRAIRFYDPLMELLGYPRGGRNEEITWWRVFNGNNTTALGVGKPFDKQNATTGNGVMVALIARSAEHIQQIHALALNHSRTDEGAPGLRRWDMRMLKCYLANNRRGHFVMADEAMSAPGIYMELRLMWLSSGAACKLFL